MWPQNNHFTSLLLVFSCSVEHRLYLVVVMVKHMWIHLKLLLCPLEALWRQTLVEHKLRNQTNVIQIPNPIFINCLILANQLTCLFKAYVSSSIRWNYLPLRLAVRNETQIYKVLSKVIYIKYLIHKGYYYFMLTLDQRKSGQIIVSLKS